MLCFSSFRSHLWSAIKDEKRACRPVPPNCTSVELDPPPSENIIQDTNTSTSRSSTVTPGSLQLVAWILLANSCRQMNFRHKPLNSFGPHGPNGLRNSTSLCGRFEVAVVIRGTSIPFRVMQSI